MATELGGGPRLLRRRPEEAEIAPVAVDQSGLRRSRLGRSRRARPLPSRGPARVGHSAEGVGRVMGHDGGPCGPWSAECKEDYAVYVRGIMPNRIERGAGEPMVLPTEMFIFRHLFEMQPHLVVDILRLMHIMDLTSSVEHLGGHFGDPQTLVSQTRSTTQTRLPQSETRVGRRRTVRCHRLLRSLRPTAGEVRDGAARARRPRTRPESSRGPTGGRSSSTRSGT